MNWTSGQIESATNFLEGFISDLRARCQSSGLRDVDLQFESLLSQPWFNLPSSGTAVLPEGCEEIACLCIESASVSLSFWCDTCGIWEVLWPDELRFWVTMTDSRIARSLGPTNPLVPLEGDAYDESMRLVGQILLGLQGSSRT